MLMRDRLDESNALLERGLRLAISGERRAALAAAADAKARAGPSFAAHERLGVLFSYCGAPDQARDAFRRALDANPTDCHAAYNLATALRMTGELNEAEAICDSIVEKEPLHVGAHALRTDLRVQTTDRNHIKELTALLRSDRLSVRSRVKILFAIAKECEDVGDDVRGFSYIKNGCDAQRALQRYVVDDDIRTLEQIGALHTADNLAKLGHGLRGPEPIFVVGMPRTGTTLIERILASHQEVISIGETHDFALALVHLVGTGQGAGSHSRTLVEASLKIDGETLGQAYLERARPQNASQQRWLDKMPLNSLYLGLISQALPHAKLILVRRDPMDTVYAMYKVLFAGGYPYSYKLDELARYFIAWDRLMQHWSTNLGDRLCITSYEAIVLNPEITTRQLLEFCGLPWQQECLRFHENTHPSMTMSATQVRRGLYSSSIGRWRRHAIELRVVSELFRRNGITFQ